MSHGHRGNQSAKCPEGCLEGATGLKEGMGLNGGRGRDRAKGLE